MRVEVDSMQRIVLIDNHSPYGSLILKRMLLIIMLLFTKIVKMKKVRTVFGEFR